MKLLALLIFSALVAATQSKRITIFTSLDCVKPYKGGKWCYLLRMLEIDPIDNDEIAESPEICSNERTSNSSIIGYIDTDGWNMGAEVVIEVQHTCNANYDIIKLRSPEMYFDLSSSRHPEFFKHWGTILG